LKQEIYHFLVFNQITYILIWKSLIFHRTLSNYLTNFKLKNMRKIILVVALIIIYINMTLHAQVTIGADIAPLPGSLLDVKQNNTNDANATKGIMLPRVRLSDLRNLYPMFGSPGSPDSKYASNKKELDSKHTGLIVYNVNESVSANLKKGIYYWDGAKWVYADPSVWNTLGNAGTDSTVNYIGTSDKQPLILSANKNEGLRISTEGVTKLKHAPFISNSNAQVLVRDITNGDMGITGTIPTRLMLVQSAELQSYAKDSGDSPGQDGITFNSGGIGNARAVLWKSDDVKTNNLLDEQTHASGAPFEYFIIKAKGLYEVGGFMLYEPNCQYNLEVKTLADAIQEIHKAYAAVNVAIQRQEAGETTWENIAATRVIWSGRAIYGTASSATVPPITVLFDVGDKIRLVFYRPDGTFGRPHGKGNEGEWGITYVYGIDVKKGLRVTLIEEQQ
jgi:hypothetical protein